MFDDSPQSPPGSADDMPRLVLSAMAPNRIGLIASISRALDIHDCLIRELSHTVVGGTFTVFVVVQPPAADWTPDRLEETIEKHCGSYSVRAMAGWAESRSASDAVAASETEPDRCVDMFLRLTGRDTRGILRLLSARLAVEAIDIQDLSAKSGHVAYESLLRRLDEWADDVEQQRGCPIHVELSEDPIHDRALA